MSTPKLSRFTLVVTLAAAGACTVAGQEPSDGTTDTTSGTTLGAETSGGDDITTTSLDESGVDSTSATMATTTGDVDARCDDLRVVVEAAADSYRESQGLVGLALGFATEGCAPWTAAWGMASVSAGTELTDQHLLRAASVTKMYTAALMLKLAEEEVLTIDDSLEVWGIDVPSAPMITLRQLLNHTSGLADYQYNVDFQQAITVDPDRIWSPQELIDFTVELGPIGPPGGAYAYSNANYILAGMVVETATGQSYAEALRSRVLDPLGLAHTYLEGEERWEEPFATGHVVVAGGPPEDSTGFYHASQVWSAGAIVSTVGDLRTWIAALLASDYLAAQSQAELVDFVPAPGLGGYGLGVFAVEAGTVTAYGHNGAILGFQASTLYHPGTGTTVSIMHNQMSVESNDELSGDPTVLGLEIIEATIDHG